MPIISESITAQWRILVMDWRNAKRQLGEEREFADPERIIRCQEIVAQLATEKQAFRQFHGWIKID